MAMPMPYQTIRPRGGAIAALGVGVLAAVVGRAWLVGRRRQPAVEARTRARLAPGHFAAIVTGQE